jgi:hypothetical protein
VSIFCDQYWSSNHDLDLYSDAAGNRHLGCGAYMDGEWIFFKKPMFWSNEIYKDITLLELLPILLAFYTWESKL